MSIDRPSAHSASKAAFETAFALHRNGQLKAALAGYDALLKAEPNHAEAWHYSGLLLFQAGHPEPGRARVQRAAELGGQAPDVFVNLARIEQHLGHYPAAILALQRALRLAPNLSDAWANLAELQLRAGRPSEAIEAAKQALRRNGRNGMAWFQLAQAEQALGRFDTAFDAASQAQSCLPGHIAPLGLLAQLEAELGRLDASRARLHQAMARHPNISALALQLAELEERAGNHEAACAAYERVLALEPEHGPALSQLLFLRKQMCYWPGLEALQARVRAAIARGVPLLTPFNFLSDPGTRLEQRQCAALWSRQFQAEPLPGRALSADGRLRIGYLSADFHQHATALLAAGLFEAHDRERFVVHGYSTGPDDASPMRARIVDAFDAFLDGRHLTARQLAERIAADGIDILVDLKGHTQNAPTGVLAFRPAPIQVNYLGYPGTLAMAGVDYLIGDPIVTPLSHQADYSECLVQIPCYQINDRSRPVAATTPTRAELGLPEEAVVLCSFNNSYKLNPSVFDAWARILDAIPDSVLWLLAKGPRDPCIENLRREIAARGIAPERLVFAHYRPNPEYLALYRQADLFLDTWPYNAHTTASDALWAGCPVLTWLGETFAGRVAASLLSAVGLPELVCGDIEDYIATAIALAQSPERRTALRAHLEGPGRNSALFDTATTTAALEAAYERMAEQYRAGVREAFSIA